MERGDAWVELGGGGPRVTLVRGDGSDARERDAVPDLLAVSPDGGWALTWASLVAANHERVGILRTPLGSRAAS